MPISRWKSVFSNWTHHATVITKQQNESTRLLFSLLNSCPCAKFYAGEHVHWPKTHRPKTQKSAGWKPVLNIREQNSSHLQDFSNAFWTKRPCQVAKSESESFCRNKYNLSPVICFGYRNWNWKVFHSFKNIIKQKKLNNASINNN